MEEIIEIRFKDIEMRLPESRESLDQARKLLNLFEETLPPKIIPKSRVRMGVGVGTEVVVFQKFNPDKSIVSPDEYKFQCEKFDISNLSAKKAGKSTYWMSDEKVCIEREGYAAGLRVYVTLADLRYLYEHQDEIKNVSKSRRYHITGFLKDVDLSGEQAAEIKEPESEEPEPEPQVKLEFFHEDTGFDYMAVHPKQVGRAQVYSNSNRKIVIKVDREIVLTTQDMIEKLLKYDEKELTSSLRGINSQKQNILRVYLAELKKSKL